LRVRTPMQREAIVRLNQNDHQARDNTEMPNTNIYK